MDSKIMNPLSVIQTRPQRTIPSFAHAVLRAIGRATGAIADELLNLVIRGVAVLARWTWWLGCAGFVLAAAMSTLFWFNGMAPDAWQSAGVSVVALGVMAGGRFVERSCILHGVRDADFT